MTPIDLLNCLAEFVKEQTKNIILQVKTEPGGSQKERAAEVHKMRLPKKEDSTRRIPYILLQILTGKDDLNKERRCKESTCQIRIVVGTYSEDENVGAYDVLNVLMKIRTELQAAGIIADRYVLQDPLDYIIYPDDYHPYYFGEMITNWSIPIIKREVEELWQ